MSTYTRKRQEFDLRQQQILQLARTRLLTEGFSGLSMERLAADMQFAKGTLYNHFPNKEEIVVALAIESLDLRRRLFERATISCPGSRQRMMAIGCACDLYPTYYRDYFLIEEMLRSGAILEKATENRQNMVRQQENRMMAIVAGVVRDAVAEGDLSLPNFMSAEEFVFGFWALLYGSRVLILNSPALVDIGITHPQRSIYRHAWTLMNGYDWKPMLSFELAESFMEATLKSLKCDDLESSCQ